ncbi:MAG: DUF6249 domain-containing protein [Vicinamibacterales bacterium]
MEQLFGMVFLTGMIAGVLVIFMAIRQRSQFLEMQHRERMAMIERGMTPEHAAGRGLARRGAAAPRFMTLGIITVALGLGLMSIISIAAGEPEVGVGIGGAIVIVGTALITNSLVSRHMAPASLDALPAPPPVPPPDRLE